MKSPRDGSWQIGVYIVALAALLHVGWAISIACNPEISMTTPTAPYFWLLGSKWSVAGSLAGISLVALVAKVQQRESWWQFFGIVPQQLALMISSWSSLLAIYRSAYADGVVRSRHFIFDDQWQNIITMLLHSVFLATLAVRLWYSKVEHGLAA